MAVLTTTNVQRDYFGAMKVIYGEWSAAAGDAATTFAVEGGRVYLAQFVREDAAAVVGIQWPVPISVSTSGSTTTITVYATGATTAGRFMIIYK